MSLGDHLDELQRRLLLAVVVPLPLAFLLFFVSDWMIQWLSRPAIEAMIANGLPPKLQVLSPVEPLMQQFKLSIIGAAVLSAPWLLWQIWQFIRPGLYAQERRFAQLLVPLSTVLTLAAVALTFFVMLPLMLSVLIAFGARLEYPADITVDSPAIAEIWKQNPVVPRLLAPPEHPTPNSLYFLWRGTTDELRAVLPDGEGGTRTVHVEPAQRPLVEQVYQLAAYINFILLTLLGTVLAFQMPVVIMLLGWVGIASPAWLRSQRRYAFFICAVAAAVITPSSDPVSMLIMLIPLYGLYELGILLLVLAPAQRVAEGTVVSLKRQQRSVPRRSDDDDRDDRDDRDDEPPDSSSGAPAVAPGAGASGRETALFDESPRTESPL